MELARVLAAEPVVAVDTESNSLHAYNEQVCLIQVSTPEADTLVDPLALEDITPLEPIFSAQTTQKVFHAAEYDLICLQRDYGFEFSNIFDTMVAARILGRKKVGLGNMLQAEFGVHLNKRYQRANWGERPLPPDMLSYARLDTRYLIPLRDRLEVELKESGRWPLAEEDFERATQVEMPDFDSANQNFWRISGAYDLAPRQAAVLRELHLYREGVAETQDRPPFKVISNRTLLAIAEAIPRDEDALAQLPGMTRGQMKRHGQGLLEAVARGQEAPPAYPPRTRRPSDAYLNRLDTLREWRKLTAREMGVPSDVVLPRDVLDAIVEADPSAPEELAGLMGDLPWRLDRYGARILDQLSRVRRPSGDA